MTTRLSGMSVDSWEDVRATVRRVADLLDKHAEADEKLVPKNWRQLIDLRTLELSSGARCVLGQIAHHNERGTKTYNDMTFALHLGVLDAIEHGFIAGSGIRFDYGVLVLAWRQYLEQCHAD